jgi:hypothetical protein
VPDAGQDADAAIEGLGCAHPIALPRQRTPDHALDFPEEFQRGLGVALQGSHDVVGCRKWIAEERARFSTEEEQE